MSSIDKHWMVRKAGVVAWYIWSDYKFIGLSTWIQTVTALPKDLTAAKLSQKIYFRFHSPLIELDWGSALGPLAVSALPSLMLYSNCSRNHCPTADPDWICPIYSRKRNTIPSMILIWNLTDLDEFKIRQTRPLTSQKALFKCNLFTSKETPISYIAHFLYFFSHDFFFWKLMFHNIRKKYSLIFSSTPSES